MTIPAPGSKWRIKKCPWAKNFDLLLELMTNNCNLLHRKVATLDECPFHGNHDRMIFCVQWLILHENYLALLLRDPGIIDFIRLCGFQL